MGFAIEAALSEFAIFGVVLGMASLRKRLFGIMDMGDIIIEVVDARFPEDTRNVEIERFAERNGKKLLIALNKADYVPRRVLAAAIRNISSKAIIVSAKKKMGIAVLRGRLKKEASEEKPVKVAFVGYPNTGKSSLINALSGRHSALTSSKAGFTQGAQYIRLSKEVLLIDSPGVIGYYELDEAKLALLSAKSFGQIKDLEGCAEHIISFILKTNPSAITKKYGIPLKEASYAQEILEGIAEKKGFLLKGGVVDPKRAARLVIEEWQKGEIRVFK